mmetsp:Transcript_11659/g.27155  ORF Transcript_11659/g.27155 Transcript_11659/m.27155 type:complete len:219 (+) Transcript_11659:619-1275(+)
MVFTADGRPLLVSILATLGRWFITPSSHSSTRPTKISSMCTSVSASWMSVRARAPVPVLRRTSTHSPGLVSLHNTTGSAACMVLSSSWKRPTRRVKRCSSLPRSTPTATSATNRCNRSSLSRSSRRCRALRCMLSSTRRSTTPARETRNRNRIGGDADTAQVEEREREREGRRSVTVHASPSTTTSAVRSVDACTRDGEVVVGSTSMTAATRSSGITS